MLQIIKRAVKVTGSISALAKILKSPRTSLYQWKQIPGKYCIKLSKILDIPMYRIRPDIYPKETARIAKKKRKV